MPAMNSTPSATLTDEAARIMHGTGELNAGTSMLDAGAPGRFQVAGDEVRLGTPFIFNKDDIDRFAF
jgi:hypothetical protein